MDENMFFARTQQLSILEKRIRDLKDGYRQNLAIIGDEHVGKTSIIFKFLHKFCDNRIIPIYIEVRQEPLDCLCKRFIAVLLYNFLLNSEMPLKEDLEFLIAKSSFYIPKTIEKVKALLHGLSKKKKDSVFTELLSLTEIIHEETGKHCVIIFDEFHKLENIGVKKIFAEWAKILILQKATLYIIISSLKHRSRAILSKDLSLLFGNFEVITIEPFDIKTAHDYLAHALRSISLHDALKNFIVNFTGGCPLYLKVISEMLTKSPQDDLVSILEELLFDPAGLLFQNFSNYVNRFQGSTAKNEQQAILFMIADGHNKIKEIAHLLRKTKKELSNSIATLLELDTITQSGDFLKINDRVLSFWLKFVYSERLNSLTVDAKNQKNLFRLKINSMIQEFIATTQKPVSERMMELLHLFQDDQIQIERKKLRLNHFREIKFVEFKNSSLNQGLLCRSEDCIWVIAFKYDALTEEDIGEFAKECKKFRHKLQQKIIITFQDVDANSRLKALQEKIWTWDINNVNHVLDLFSKQRITVA
ncbi:MAG: hypothetical protein WDL87_05280 [Candidatus Omnitrophota bacterium]|jgi:hypothetical protein